MALQKQTVTIDFGYGGIDQKTDEKLIGPTRLDEAYNARFNKTGRIDRRLGNETAAFLSKESVMLFSTDTQVTSIVGKTDSSLPLTYRVLSTTRSDSLVNYWPTTGVANVVTEQSGPTQAFSLTSSFCRADANNYFCTVMNTGLGGGLGTIYIEIYDRQTGQLSYQGTPGLGTRARVLAHPGTVDSFLVTYVDNTSNVQHKIVTPANGYNNITGLATVSVSSSEYDVLALKNSSYTPNGAVIVCAYAKGASGIVLRNAAWPDNTGTGNTGFSSTIIAITCSRIALGNVQNVAESTSKIRLMYFDSAANLIKTATYNSSLSVQLAATTLTSSSVVPNHMTAVSITSGDLYDWFTYVEYARGGTNNYDQEINVWGMNASNTPTFIQSVKGMGLASKAASLPGGQVAWVWGAYPYANEQTNFLLGTWTDSSNHLTPVYSHARLFHTTALGLISQTGAALPNLQVTGSQFITSQVSLRRSNQLGFVSDQYSIYGVKFDNQVGNGWLSSVNRGENLITGGHLTWSNGLDVVPSGPQLFPNVLSTLPVGGSGSLGLGSYSVVAVYEYTDTSGRVRQSAPSVPSTITLTSTQNTFSVTIENYRIPDNLQVNTRLKTVVYRTLVNAGGVYYRCGQGSGLSTVNNVTITCGDSDTTIGGYAPLTQGVPNTAIENWQPSAPIAIANNGRRYICVQADRPTFVMQSKAIVQGEGVTFFEDVGRTISPYGGVITALGALGDKWLAWKDAATFVASGDGAADNGTADDMSEFEVLSTSIGCSAPRSVQNIGIGLIWKADHGFYFMGPDLVPKFIGDAVEDYNTYTVTDSAFNKAKGEYYAILSSGDTLVLTVYQTATGNDLRWTVDTNCGGNSVVVANDKRYFALSSPSASISTTIFREGTDYVDRNISVTSVPDFNVTTSWVKLGALQGYGCVYKATLLGTFPSAQTSTTITVQVAYDYEATFSQTHTIDSANILQNGVAQFEVRPAKHDCQAIRFKIFSSPPASLTNGAQGFSLNQIQLVVGVKPPANKMAASRRATKQ